MIVSILRSASVALFASSRSHLAAISIMTLSSTKFVVVAIADASTSPGSTAYVAGSNSYGEMGRHPSLVDVLSPPEPAADGVVDFGGGGYAGVEAGQYHTLILGCDGRVYLFGRNDGGQLGRPGGGGVGGEEYNLELEFVDDGTSTSKATARATRTLRRSSEGEED